MNTTVLHVTRQFLVRTC